MNILSNGPVLLNGITSVRQRTELLCNEYIPTYFRSQAEERARPDAFRSGKS